MRTRQEKGHVSRALREVWEWKDAIWEEVEHLPFDEAVRTVAERAHSTAMALGFHTTASPSARLTTPGSLTTGTRSARVADAGAVSRVQKTRRSR